MKNGGIKGCYLICFFFFVLSFTAVALEDQLSEQKYKFPCKFLLPMMQKSNIFNRISDLPNNKMIGFEPTSSISKDDYSAYIITKVLDKEKGQSSAVQFPSNDYKVLRLVDIRRYVDDYDLQAKVYLLNTNSWKRIDGVPRYKIKWPERQVFVNGVVHFLASRRVNDDKHNLTLGFHVGDEEFKEIMLPESFVNESSLSLNVSVCDELIIVLEQRSLLPGGGMHIWVMEEYGMVQSWTRIFSFNGLGDVLGFKRNRELFLQMYTQEIVCFKLGNHDIKHFGVRGYRGLAFINYFIESLELLDNANAMTDANVENDTIGDAPGVVND